MTTEQAGIPLDSAVAQQHHSQHAAERTPRPEPLPIATAAALKPDTDPTALHTIGKAIGCILRPYPIDDSDPRGSRRRIAIAVAGVALAVSAVLVAGWARS
jgi:hypothetical protein